MSIFKNDYIELKLIDDNYCIELKNNTWSKTLFNYILSIPTDVNFGLINYLEHYEKILDEEHKDNSDFIGHIHKFVFSEVVRFTPIQKWKKTRKNKLFYDEVEQFMKDIGIFMNCVEVNERKTVPFISLQHIFVFEVNDRISNFHTTRFLPLFIDDSMRWYDVYSKDIDNSSFYGLNVNKRFFKIDSKLKKQDFGKHFLSPEWISIVENSEKNILELPFETSCTNWVYSLGLCAVYLLTYNKTIPKNVFTKEQITFLIDDILHTPLYSCIVRCLETNYKSRVFIML